MLTTRRFQKFILGDINVISEIDQSRILFLARTIVVVIAISIFFLGYDLFLGYPSSLFIYIPFVIIFGFALHLLKRFKYDHGRVIFLIALNFFVYIIMSSIPEDSMSALFYLAIIVVEYVLLGHERKYWLITLLSLTFCLYLFDSYSDISLLPMRQYDEDTLYINKIVDFVICIIGVLMSIKLLIDYLQHIIAERNKDNEALKQANIQLDKYSYRITHDLRGPIHSMLRLIELPSIDKSNYDNHIDDMKENLQHIMHMINEVTEQARNKNLDIHKEKFNVSQLVKVAWELVKYAPEAKSINFLFDIPLDLEIETDKRRMSGILNNLITNAIRYHDTSKTSQYIKLTAFVKEDWFHLSVEDNGLGIDKKYQQKVFDMFYRASNILGGSGLGLFIVKESVEKLSGKIKIESSSGKGTTFSLKIPLNDNSN
ncbi:MAG: ATP-binding protein [Cyclobacteriaceae bacterium]